MEDLNGFFSQLFSLSIYSNDQAYKYIIIAKECLFLENSVPTLF